MMAEVRLTPQKLNKAGITPAYTGSLLVANTYLVRNTGRMFLHFKKGAAVDANVTIETPMTVDGLAIAENVVVVPATTGDKMIGPFPPTIFNDGVGDVRFATDDVDGLTVAVVEL
jgi:hypothetical protein